MWCKGGACRGLLLQGLDLTAGLGGASVPMAAPHAPARQPPNNLLLFILLLPPEIIAIINFPDIYRLSVFPAGEMMTNMTTSPHVLLSLFRNLAYLFLANCTIFTHCHHCVFHGVRYYLVSEGYLSVSLIRPHGNSPEVWIVWILMVMAMMIMVITIKSVYCLQSFLIDK